MKFEFDPAKDTANLAKHGVPLLFGARVFDDQGRIVLSSHRPIDGEFRWKVIGQIDGRLWTAVYVERDGIRLISVRRSCGGERRDYDEAALRPLDAGR